ncbi:MAG: hypothetical protein ACRBBP_04315 [Bdellovibrionales bacterium]
MPFKVNFKIQVSFILGSLVMASCSPHHSLPEENIIGERLDTVSYTSGVENSQKINMFDETTGRIHSFDLLGLNSIESYKVLNPQDEHYIIASNDTSFVVDLSESQLSLYRYDGTSDLDLVDFMGKPISSAFNPSTGHLVVYDDLNSVSLMRISTEGELEEVWIGGPLVSGDKAILAGDISATGDLILSLKNGSIAVVDIEESIIQEQWVYRLDSNVHSDIKWVSKISGDVILYQSSDALVLYDYVAGIALDTKDYPDNYETLAYGKNKDAHVIYRSRALLSNDYFVAYVEENEIKLKEVVNHQGADGFHQSRLDLSSGQWSYISSAYIDVEDYGEDGAVDYVLPSSRRDVLSYRFSDMLIVSKVELPDDAKLKRAKDYIFALYPSELGYAERLHIKTEDVEEMRNFNIPFIDEEVVEMKVGG